MKMTLFGATAIVLLGFAGAASAQFMRDSRRLVTTQKKAPPPQEMQVHKCRVTAVRQWFMSGDNTEHAEVALSKCLYPGRGVLPSFYLTFNRNYPELGKPINVGARVVPETVFARWVAQVTAAMTSGKTLSVWCDSTGKIVDGRAYCSAPQGIGIGNE
ncbi:MAG: hypothetical protein HYY84_06810 [Deltaproteobacteria bacterium]|nr:hypothetical protein [Deltaproteobacteria bacterium]